MAKNDTSEYKEGIAAKKKTVVPDNTLEVKPTPKKKQVEVDISKPKNEVAKASANYNTTLASKLESAKEEVSKHKSTTTSKGKALEMKVVPEKNISALRSIAPSPRAARTFKVYDGSTLIGEGSSPISLANKLKPNTNYSNLKIAAVEGGLQSKLVDVPSFKTLEEIISVTGLTITPTNVNTTETGTAQFSYEFQPSNATNKKLKSVTADIADAANITVDDTNKKINVEMLGQIKPNLLDPTTHFPVQVTGATILPTANLLENYKNGVTYYITLRITPGEGFTPQDMTKARIRIGDAGNIEINANFKNLGNNLFQTGFKYNTTSGVTNKLTIRQPQKADGTFNHFTLEEVIIKASSNTDLAKGITITATTEDGNKTAKATTTVVYGKESSIPVTGITLPKNNYAGKVGTTLAPITPTIQPSNATVQTYSVKSGDSTKVQVQADNSLKLLAEVERCPITFTTTDGGFTATAQVTVTGETPDIKPTSIEVSPNPLRFPKGSQGAATITISPDNTSNHEAKIGTVTGEGINAEYKWRQILVTGTKVGKGTVEVLAAGDESVKTTLNVEVTDADDTKVTRLVVDPTSVDLDIMKSANTNKGTHDLKTSKGFITVSFAPENATNKGFTLDSNEPDAMKLEITEGVGFKITALKATKTEGGATLTVTSTDNPDAKAFVKVNIVEKTIPAIEGINFFPDSLTVKVGAEGNTTGQYVPQEGQSYYQIKNVTSDKPDVSTPRFLPISTTIVAEGHKEGTAQFTVEAWNPNVPDKVVKKTLPVTVTK